jgi:cytochrome c5
MEGEIEMISRHFALCILALASVPALALAAQENGKPEAKAYKDPVRRQAGQPQDDGERVFKQNCSRCHTAPEGFSPSISGTIVRHMRVRAALSQHDEEALLHFFNP